MSEQTGTMQDFLSHQGGNRGKKVGLEWEGSVDVWIHRHSPIEQTWGRWVPKVDVSKDPDTGVEKPAIFSSRVRSLEDQETNENQYFRSRLTGKREYPPKRDPIDFLIEAVRAKVLSGSLGFAAPIFRWETPSDERIVHAAGLWGYGKKLSDAQLAEMRKQGVSPRDGWKESLIAKMNWLFAVVNDKKPEDGVRVAVCSVSLGNHTRDEIVKAKKSLGDAKGDPTKNPYCIRWEHHDDKTLPFDKQYEATRLERVDLRPEIARLIDDPTAAPSFDRYKERPNLLALRNNLESHCLIKLDWEAIFAPAMAWYAQNGWSPGGSAERSDQEDEGPGDVGTTSAAPAIEVRSSPPQFSPATGVVLYDCDGPKGEGGCTNKLRATDMVCSACGYSYAPKVPEPPPPPQRLKRSAIASASALVPAPAAPSFPPPSSELPVEIEKDDHIPWD